ncbi:hypothetical protein GCM10023196_030780 [Actinoallomurus vinaceus]|uniref:Transposase n=1 Tax=Actinoallomurus vinaceus TaxID=1080074 RepID=A0ABP8UAT1_9ACTN
MPRAAAELYRTLPAEFTRHVPEHGSRRVLSAIAAELEHRSPAELAERIARNWEHWRYRTSAREPVRGSVAVAIRLARRGIDCPDVRCEDGHQLDLEAPCKACEQLAVERISGSVEEPPGERPGADRALRRAPAARSSGDEPLHQDRRGRVDVPTAAAAAARPPADAARYGALARALLKARTDAERDAIPCQPQKAGLRPWSGSDTRGHLIRR